MYTVIIEYDAQTGTYAASSPDVDDELNTVLAIGDSIEDVTARFRNALEGHFAFLLERGEPIPQPRHTVTKVPAPELPAKA